MNSRIFKRHITKLEHQISSVEDLLVKTLIRLDAIAAQLKNPEPQPTTCQPFTDISSEIAWVKSQGLDLVQYFKDKAKRQRKKQRDEEALKKLKG